MTTVGFGRGVITPALPVALAGFGGRPGPAAEVHSDLEVRALLLSSGEVTCCLLVCDLLGMSAEFADPVRAGVADLLGIPGAEALGWPTPDG